MNSKKYMLQKHELKPFIEPFIYARVEDTQYACQSIDPQELLTWDRLDLAFKLFYLKLKGKHLQLAQKVYMQDIKAQTLGDFEEFGNEQKNSIQKYIQEFNKTFESLKENGFDRNKTLIPLAKNSSILNGAHRVASAIYLHENIECTYLNIKPFIIDYKYFYERNVSTDKLDTVVNKFIEYSENTYLAFLWPSGQGHKDNAESKFSNVIYKKKIVLNSKGALNLLTELYKHMDWVGNEENGFQGIHQKLLECFPTFESVYVIAFQAKDLEEVRTIKEEVRNIYSLGFSSIHITDTKEEAIRISQLVFNDNGLHFLNYADPYRYIKYHKELEEFDVFLSLHNIDKDDVVIDSSSVLALYGIRKNSDLDYLTYEHIQFTDTVYDTHDESLSFHEKDKNDLLYDPSFYFQYKGFKFISFQQLYRMKKNRNEEKDINDIKLMDAYMSNDSFKKWATGMKQKIFYLRIKSRRNVTLFKLYILKKTGLYTPVKWLYYKVKGLKK